MVQSGEYACHPRADDGSPGSAIMPPNPPTHRRPAAIPAASWQFLEDLDLEQEMAKPAKTTRELPRWFRESLRKALDFGLRE